MPKLLDLSGERAGPAFSEPVVDYPGDPTADRKHEPPPLDSGVAARGFRIEEVVVFDEQQAVDDERRDRREILIGPLGIAGLVERVAVAIVEFQPGAGLLAVNRIAPLVDEPLQGRRPARLLRDREMAGAEGF